jgi:hypothetical protein
MRLGKHHCCPLNSSVSHGACACVLPISAALDGIAASEKQCIPAGSLREPAQSRVGSSGRTGDEHGRKLAGDLNVLLERGNI